LVQQEVFLTLGITLEIFDTLNKGEDSEEEPCQAMTALAADSFGSRLSAVLLELDPSVMDQKQIRGFGIGQIGGFASSTSPVRSCSLVLHLEFRFLCSKKDKYCSMQLCQLTTISLMSVEFISLTGSSVLLISTHQCWFKSLVSETVDSKVHRERLEKS
jgi:hypothetical protein